MQFHHDQNSYKIVQHLFIGDISDGGEKWNIWFKMIMKQTNLIT